jgi:hypothetical protein
MVRCAGLGDGDAQATFVVNASGQGVLTFVFGQARRGALHSQLASPACIAALCIAGLRYRLAPGTLQLSHHPCPC